MAQITYKSVIKAAITGFNKIQNTIATNFGTSGSKGLKSTDNITETVTNGSNITNVYSPDFMNSAISKLAVIRGGGSDEYVTGRVEIYDFNNDTESGSSGSGSGSSSVQTKTVTLYYSDGTIETVNAIIT